MRKAELSNNGDRMAMRNDAHRWCATAQATQCRAEAVHERGSDSEVHGQIRIKAAVTRVQPFQHQTSVTAVMANGG